MRPLRLDMSGFTVFREQTTVDFTDADFFALVGPTGSGKSTVLDAITFALYGQVPRWGTARGIVNALSPSAVEARVRLVFESANERYVATRVVRRDGKGRVNTSGAGLQLMPRGFDVTKLDTGLSPEDLGEVLAGTPAEMDKAVQEAVGLPYEQFTTCVVLPQGQFADFLHAKPATRQQILVNLLDLGVYEEVQRRATTRAGAADAKLSAVDQLLSGLDDTDDAHLAAAADHLDRVIELAEGVEAALPDLRTAATRTEAATVALATLDAEIARLRGVRAPSDVAAIAGAAADARAAAADAVTAVHAAEEREEKVRGEVAGSGDPAALRLLLEAHGELDNLTEQAAELTAMLTSAEAEHGAAAVSVAAARAEHARAVAALEAARQAYQDAQNADRATALRLHLTVGDACPVCAQTVTALPVETPTGYAVPVDGSGRAVDHRHGQDATGLGAAGHGAAGHPGAHPDATGRTADATGNAGRGTGSAGRGSTTPDGRGRAGAPRPRGEAQAAPADPAAQRAAGRSAVAAAEAEGKTARAAADRAQKLVAEREQAARELERTLDRARARHDDLQHRLTATTDKVAGSPGPAALRRELDEIAALRKRLDTAGASVRRAREAARRAQTEAERAEQRLRATWQGFDTARDAVAPFGPPATDRNDVAAAWTGLAGWAAEQVARRTDARAEAETELRAARGGADGVHLRIEGLFVEVGLSAPVKRGESEYLRAAAVATERAEGALRRIEERREQAAELREQRAVHERDGRVAKTLAGHLRANNFERWLLEEALDLLVDGGSRILRELSGGQYELVHDKGEFWVVDHHDAGLRRGVRTLSGGETFQASLALALALSEQLAGMSTTAASLESIVLDEGFGTLDAVTLDSVAATLENLAARGDRMVGVVTHVGALAERIPVRFEVRKDARSARVTRSGL
ncbi:exonuclease SbcC [Catenuloplanes nepalensis]|uniref:Nuclease SbcCD subunit C n=1 Tax=Catenuloplanes nepalensis TaxID=587533 RepID=A0ABT9MZM5_9ACTN|nr:SMC family ATPase [Catenuloplanes nepalensis]MDP9796898.1 exonuclease SbcC [Catenuloplanes nepalensis]